MLGANVRVGPEALDRLALRQAMQFLKKCGKETPAQSASRIMVLPSAARPATANAMAMR